MMKLNYTNMYVHELNRALSVAQKYEDKGNAEKATEIRTFVDSNSNIPPFDTSRMLEVINQLRQIQYGE